MSSWVDLFYFSIVGAAMLLSALGLWFTAIIPGIDRWSRRFFLDYFAVFMLCCLAGTLEGVLEYYAAPASAIYATLLGESLLLAVPLPMLTIYLLHCCEEDIRSSWLLRAVVGLWAVYFVLIVSDPLIGVYSYVAPSGQYYRGPLYSLLLLPLIVILLLNLAGVLRRRARLSRKSFVGLLVAVLPMTAALIVQMFSSTSFRSSTSASFSRHCPCTVLFCLTR